MDRDEELAKLNGLAASGKLWRALEKYLRECTAAEDRRLWRFPNAAGFARHLGVSLGALKALGEHEPALYERICTVLEDEALNADISATLLSAYLKQRLGYGERQEHATSTVCDGDRLQLIFEHDILADGE